MIFAKRTTVVMWSSRTMACSLGHMSTYPYVNLSLATGRERGPVADYRMLRKFTRSCFSLSVSPILKRRSKKSTSPVRSPAEPLAK
jgi:hypothetical protein